MATGGLDDTMRRRTILAAATVAAGALLGWLAASGRLTVAQEKSDSAKLADGAQLPKPDPKFKGKIAETYKASTPRLSAAGQGSEGAARTSCSSCSMMWVLGCAATFGGPVPTPHMDKLANNGLKYTRFHTTALCSADAGRAAHRAQPSLRRHRRHHRDGHRLSRLHRHHSAKLRHGARNPARQRLRHRHVRQVAQHARTADQPSRVHSTFGPRVRDSTTSTASTRARRTSTTRCFTGTPRRSTPRRPRSRATISWRT